MTSAPGGMARATIPASASRHASPAMTITTTSTPLHREIWEQIAMRLSCQTTHDLRLVCKLACCGADDTRRKLDVWDKFYFYPRVARNPSGRETAVLLAKLPRLNFIDFFFHTGAGFVETATSVVQFAEDMGKTTCIASGFFVDRGRRVVATTFGSLRTLVQHIVMCHCVSMVVVDVSMS